MSSWLSVTSDEGWSRQTARWCLLSDTLEMDSHSLDVCCPVCLNLSPLAENWSCLLFYWEGIFLFNRYMACLKFYTHTHTHVLLCAFHGHCSEWWQELIASEFSTGQQTHTSVAGGVNAHTEKKNHFWCDELGLIQCPRRWKGSDLLLRVKRPTLQFNSMATYTLALIQPFRQNLVTNLLWTLNK